MTRRTPRQVEESELGAKRTQVGVEFVGGVEHDAVHAELGGGLGVGGHVIYVNGFVGADFAGFQRLFVDYRVGSLNANDLTWFNGFDASETNRRQWQ